MLEEENLFFEADGEIRAVNVTTTAKGDSAFEEYGESRLQKAQQMIRDYTEYAIAAFKNVSSVEIEEITLKFGIKMSSSAGIPYITEGKAESNLEIEVKCKFPS
ncbi:MAG: CU044_2847 family protein [Oscillatoria sp. PMC 1068.18]|nr:CU044_2847 family protein [Oscillatoria sp. PMC 1076.18]MEC4991306.1 CU044_2847 family protein [Oscillatoria sp. PMC 1068.18]